MPAGAPTACKGCGQLILFERQQDGKWLVSEWDESTMRKGERHNCPNYQPKNKQPSSTLPAGKIWTGTDRQTGQFSQYKVNEQLGQVTQQGFDLILQKLTELEHIKKLVHDQNILLHTIGEEVKVLHNNLISHVIEKSDQKESFYDSQQQQTKKKTEEFGDKGENAMSDEVYDY